MSSRDVLGVMRPGGRLVVEGAGQAVGELAQGGVVTGSVGFQECAGWPHSQN